MFNTEMASSTDSSATIDEEVRRLYKRYQAAESDAERRNIALEMGELDGRRHTQRSTQHSKMSNYTRYFCRNRRSAASRHP